MKKPKSKLELSAANLGIITALPEEYAAVRQVLGCKDEIDVSGKGAGRKYSIAKLTTKTGAEHIVAIAFLSDMGNNSAAIRATQIAQHCPNLEHFIMVGIAGAVPNPQKSEDHVRLGDIVVTDRHGVVQYDLDKEEPLAVKHRNPPRPPGATLLEAVRHLTVGELQKKRPWETYIKKAISTLGHLWKRPSSAKDVLSDDSASGTAVLHPKDLKRLKGRPRVFHGPIASANKLLKNPIKRDALRDKFAVKAVEMEGSGIADSAWNLEKEYLVIRGTCDYCNPTKNDDWHHYSALAAAAYARCVIEALSPSVLNDATALSGGGGGQRLEKLRKIALRVANTNTTIEVLFGDIFVVGGLRAIAVSEYFESKLGNPVSANSLHGIFLKRCFQGQCDVFDKQVNLQLRKVTGKIVPKLEGKKKSYPIGTTVLVRAGGDRYALFALCEADPKTCKVDSNMAMLLNALDGLWRFARINSDGEPLNLPLIGSGLARIGLAPRDLLNLVILSAIKETKSKEITKVIRIVLHDSLLSEVDLREVETHWKQ